MTIQEFFTVIEMLFQRISNSAWNWKNKPRNLPVDVMKEWDTFFDLQMHIMDNLESYIKLLNSDEKINFIYLDNFKHLNFAFDSLENLEINFNFAIGALKEIISSIFLGKENSFDLPVQKMQEHFWSWRNAALF